MLGSLLRRQESRDVGSGLSWPDYLQMFEQFGFGGVSYMVPSGSIQQVTALQAVRNPVILACIMIRAMTFAEVRFVWQRLGKGARTARDLFGTSELAILEQPWPGATTGDLLARMEVDASRFGNSFWYRPVGAQALTWLDPTRMRILTGDVMGPGGNAKVGRSLLGYVYDDEKGQPEELFLPSEIVHHRPIPDPEHPFRGLSWLSALLPDVTVDNDMTEYKRGFLRNAATPALVVTFGGAVSEDSFRKFRDKLESAHTGPASAFRTLYLGAGADVKTVGSDWASLELGATQSLQETRLCVAAGVPAPIAGLAEGMKGSALNAGNYQAVRRRFADITMRPLWRAACGAASSIVSVPGGTRLWYDDRDVLFLQADLQDAATQRQSDSATIVSLVNAGFTPESVVAAVQTGDWSQLDHLGLMSVQLQPLTTQAAADPATDPTGDGNGEDGNGDEGGDDAAA